MALSRSSWDQLGNTRSNTPHTPPLEKGSSQDSVDWLWKNRYKVALGAAVGGLACFALFRYHVCTPSEYLVKTGLGIPDMAIARKTMQWPWQEVRTYNMAPLNYSFHLNNMSSEMVPFRLPVSFTIGPKDPREDLDGFKTYATKLGDLPPEKVEATIGGVIHGETRVFSAGLTIREMFEDREKFKRTVQDKIQHDMDAYGLKIYNANIAEMADQDEKTRYFQNLRQKALEGANTEMRIQVADARMKGDIGERERQSRAAQEVAHIEATIVEKQNANAQRVAHSEKDLAIVRAQCERERLLAEIDVSMATDKRKAELETEVDRARTAQQIAYLQSTQVAKTTADAESAVKEAEGRAEAIRRIADAHLYEKQKAADAVLYEQLKSAEGTLATFEAQAEGLSRLLAASEQRPDLVKFQLALQSGLFEKMATTTADAVRGMSPKIHIWNTGAPGDANANLAGLRNIFSSLPPMLDAVEGQTEFRAPEWLAGPRQGSPKEATVGEGRSGTAPTPKQAPDHVIRL